MNCGTAPLLERDAIDRIKARFDISAIGRQLGCKLIRTGHEWKALCIFHRERTPSLRFNDAKGFYHCFGCGSNGDPVRLIMQALNLSFMDALRWLDASQLPAVDPVVRKREEEADRAERLAHIDDARGFFLGSSLVVVGDPVDVYLKARGINMPPPPSVRFGMVPSWQNRETKEWGRKRPCMVIAAQDASGAVVGIQRVFFRDDDPLLGEAAVKLSLGRIKGAALRFGPIERHVNCTEGPEDGLSVREIMPDRTVLVAAGTGLMPFIGLPPEVQEVTILGQNNNPGKVAVGKTAAAMLEKGIVVREAYPPADFDDWNDWKREIRK